MGNFDFAKEVIWVLLLGVVLGAFVWAGYDIVQVLFGNHALIGRAIMLGVFSLLGMFVFLPIVVDMFYGKNDQEATKK